MEQIILPCASKLNSELCLNCTQGQGIVTVSIRQEKIRYKLNVRCKKNRVPVVENHNVFCLDFTSETKLLEQYK